MTLKISLEPILSVEHVSEAASMAEITAAFDITVAFSDIPIDDEPFRSSYIDALIKDGIDDETLKDYKEEPSFSLGEAKETFESVLIAELERRSDELGSAYPFRIGTAGNIILERKNSIRLAPVSIAYLFFRAFKLTQVVEAYLSFLSRTLDGMAEFRKTFTRIFEITACYALAAKTEGAVWMSGQHRGSTAFLEFLNDVTEFIGDGDVKTHDQLGENQQKVNDGGIDGIGFDTRQGVLTADVNGFMLGATIQKSSRSKKIIGNDEIQRVLRFFVTPPAIPFQGVMAIPFAQTLAEKQNCSDRRCIYLPEAEILSLIGNVQHHKNFNANIKQLNRQVYSESTTFLNLIER